MSIPISFMASMARGFSPLGSIPRAQGFESISRHMPEIAPSAIWLRAEFPVHRKRTLGLEEGMVFVTSQVIFIQHLAPPRLRLLSAEANVIKIGRVLLAVCNDPSEKLVEGLFVLEFLARTGTKIQVTLATG